MKWILQKDKDRWHKQDPWKKSAYSFVPYQTHFGELCGFAEDFVEPGQGFGLHPHQNMEITTIVMNGVQNHRDNTGSEGTITKNDVQTMSAGTGIRHSEFNASNTELLHSYQIWVYPKQSDIKPRHETFHFKKEDKLNQILLVISSDKRNHTAGINQDAFFSVLTLEQNNHTTYVLQNPNHGVYIHIVSGHVIIENNQLSAGDAIGVYETDKVEIKSHQSADIIFVEVPMERGIKLS